MRRSTPIMDPSNTSLQEQTQVLKNKKIKAMINKEITLFYAAFYYFQRKECELSLPMLKYYTVRTTP